MGALAFAFLMMILLVVSLFFIVGSLICLIVFNKRRKAGAKYGLPLTIVSAIILTISIVVFIIPVGFFGFIYLANSTPPPDYVVTPVFIEENGYQDTRFTANGVVYTVLDLEANNDVCEKISTPVFAYETEGFMNGAQSGNYYRIQNSHGFDLIWDGGNLLFCPEYAKDDVQAYYDDVESYEWYVGDYEKVGARLPSEAEQTLNAFPESKLWNLPEVQYRSEELTETALLQISSDGIVSKNYFWFFVVDDTAYITYQTDSDQDGTTVYVGGKLPDEIGDVLQQLQTDS